MHGRPTVLSRRFIRAVETERSRLTARLEKAEARARVAGAEVPPGGPSIGAIKTELAGLRLMLAGTSNAQRGRDPADAPGAETAHG